MAESCDAEDGAWHAVQGRRWLSPHSGCVLGHAVFAGVSHMEDTWLCLSTGPGVPLSPADQAAPEGFSPRPQGAILRLHGQNCLLRVWTPARGLTRRSLLIVLSLLSP